MFLNILLHFRKFQLPALRPALSICIGKRPNTMLVYISKRMATVLSSSVIRLGNQFMLLQKMSSMYILLFFSFSLHNIISRETQLNLINK